MGQLSSTPGITDLAGTSRQLPQQPLLRGMGLLGALSANMLNMIGVGPFITIPLILAAMGGPQAALGWCLGAVIAICDGLVWAELGAAMPGSGASYRYLLEAYGRSGLGRLMSFLFLWQIVFIAPLSAASGAVGFADYAGYLFPGITPSQLKVLAASACLVATVLLYRDIRNVERLSVARGRRPAALSSTRGVRFSSRSFSSLQVILRWIGRGRSDRDVRLRRVL